MYGRMGDPSKWEGQNVLGRVLMHLRKDLWREYNVICLLWMIRYISLLTNIFTQWILIDA